MAKNKLRSFIIYTDLPESLVHAALVKCAIKYDREVHMMVDTRGLKLPRATRKAMKKAVRRVEKN